VFAPPPSAASVQRQEAASSPPPYAGVTGSPADASASLAAAPAVATPPVDWAAMADRLYPRIEKRLREELMLQREQRGILA
jgi:hypothetical protein